MQVRFFPLSPDDQALLERQRAVVRGVVEACRGPLPEDWRCDAETLQQLVDDEVFQPTQTYELQCLGVALGDLLVGGAGFNWSMVHDAYGRDPTVRWKSTSICVNAITMISKRVENGEVVDIAHLLRVAEGRARDLELQE